MKNETGTLIFASSDKNADIAYASGFRSPDPFIYYATLTEKAVIVSKLERGRAVSEVKSDLKVYDMAEIAAYDGKIPSWKDILLALTAKFADLQWRVPSDFPLREARILEKAGISLICADKPFFPERQTKSDDEIIRIIQAQRLAEEGMAAAVEALDSAKIADDGTLVLDEMVLTSEIIRSIIDIEVLRHGGHATDTIVSCGVQASEPHNAGAGPLRSGETIVIDIFPKGPDEYHGDLTRTFVIGTPSDIAVKAYNAVRQARNEAIKLLKAGAVPSEVHERADQILISFGFETTNENGTHRGFFHGLGHGLGLNIHEEPSLSPRNSRPLEVGNVVTVEPGLYYPEWGGIRLEDIVVIRENGCEILTDCPTDIDPGNSKAK
ncbi:MAG: aminopeptidase P family protein [Kiritimatiellaeota bacterium]|nr:aminopeptidase P family protein [Kiritimatiellota bacterium]